LEPPRTRETQEWRSQNSSVHLQRQPCKVCGSSACMEGARIIKGWGAGMAGAAALTAKPSTSYPARQKRTRRRGKHRHRPAEAARRCWIAVGSERGRRCCLQPTTPTPLCSLTHSDADLKLRGHERPTPGESAAGAWRRRWRCLVQMPVGGAFRLRDEARLLVIELPHIGAATHVRPVANLRVSHTHTHTHRPTAVLSSKLATRTKGRRYEGTKGG
jgi:hypothetical protein